VSCVQMRSNYSTILNTEFEKGPYDFINSLFKVCPMDNTITNERSNVLGYFAFVSVARLARCDGCLCLSSRHSISPSSCGARDGAHGGYAAVGAVCQFLQGRALREALDNLFLLRRTAHSAALGPWRDVYPLPSGCASTASIISRLDIAGSPVTSFTRPPPLLLAGIVNLADSARLFPAPLG